MNAQMRIVCQLNGQAGQFIKFPLISDISWLKWISFVSRQLKNREMWYDHREFIGNF